MEERNPSVQRLRKLYINIGSVVIIALLMAVVIIHTNKGEPKVTRTALMRIADELESNAINIHWQWQAKARKPTIKMDHYNKEGIKLNSTYIAMSTKGWPKVLKSNEGCKELWQALLNRTMTINNESILTKYYEQSSKIPLGYKSLCRFSIDEIGFFDYDINNGNVTYSLTE